MSWLLTLLGIVSLVLLHEFGHFAVAKAVGMRVERFSLFFGPMIVKFRRGETEYGIGPIPLGGYVKISGMNPAEQLPPGEEHRSFYRQPVWKRVAVIAAGPAMNILVAFVLLAGVYWLSAQHPSTRHASVAAVEKSEPATGILKPGDVLLAVDGKPVTWQGEKLSFIGQIAAHRCAGALTQGCRAATPVHFTLQRGSRRLELSIYPRYDAELKKMLIGFSSGPVLVRDSLPVAMGAGVSQMWSVTKTTVERVAGIFTSSKDRKELHGIVGVSDVTRQAFSFGVPEALYVLALISLSLAIINLFPFLPLDGGHIFWALAEKVRGRAIPFEIMERASVAGIALVLVVAAIGLSNDISSLSNGSLTLHR
jgi:regulator of sigma E protease